MHPFTKLKANTLLTISGSLFGHVFDWMCVQDGCSWKKFVSGTFTSHACV
jgi:hypothetical protein